MVEDVAMNPETIGPAAAARQDAAASPGQATRYRVLIADDQPEHLEMIARAIERSDHGHRIELVRASDGPQALVQMERGVDLAFLDIKMPGCSGLEVVAKLRDDPDFDLPIVIVSSSSDPRDVASAEALGVAAYVEKGRFAPFRARIEGVLAAFMNGKPL